MTDTLPQLTKRIWTVRLGKPPVLTVVAWDGKKKRVRTRRKGKSS